MYAAADQVWSIRRPRSSFMSPASTSGLRGLKVWPGSLDEDLRLWAHSIRATLTGPVSGALVRAVFGAGDSQPVHDLRRRYWFTRVALVLPVVTRAIERGELPAGTDAEEVIKHVGAPLYYRMLVLDEPVTAEAADLAAAVTATAARAGLFVSGRQPVRNREA